MESKFSKYFRSPGEDIKIRGYGAFTEPEIENIKSDFAEYVTENYDKERLKTLDLVSELGEDINPKIEFIFNELINYFETLGVGPVACNEFFLVTTDRFNGIAGESSTTRGVFISNPGLDNLELRQIFFLKALAHELYHSTAIASLTVREVATEKEIDRTVSIDSGASYGAKEEPHLLEEGLAASFESYITPKIKQLFSSDLAEQYDEILLDVLDELDEPEVSDGNDVRIYETDDGTKFATSQYYKSKKVVQYLQSEIKDFLILVENARLKRYSLPLARAIEERFGKGTYRRITTAETNDADQVLSELRK